ncbi:D-alanyl-D-alanine carboxypeptidase/D-alanyl-D-alanine-endopeptidase [Myxococcus sp. K15C18031901]|uniref:D-alanyl-D-alanine carboxypeptidase/D-alanyl-D-alanine endopeptidase n=1 Tax=Myxococcus dinghuensis TaxID=2906761 RepID=UPI0020A72266|nr:D-alanyl-D-alanine carboxypeptidase/D-alanyl-D-alanine-endopeptidase [Myxococcus dinghuensis]MCP3104983.1 D-alanyl-D-alanine carboxypeptidase/D-alanyl-D-alanine-endopeptidase [Myxococcus dinghuensis]
MRRALSLPLLLASLLLPGCLRARRPEAPTVGTVAGTLFATLEAEGALASAIVLDAHTGEPLFSHREHVRLLPASTMKVVSTASVLSALGPDFRFQTPVSLEGSLHDGLFLGDIVVESSGDPSLGSWRFPETALACEQVADALQARGIRQWRGQVRVRGTPDVDAAFGPGWAWDDAAYGYSAAPTAFVFRENVVDLAVSRAEGTDCALAPTLQLTPAFANLPAQVSVDMSAERANLSCTRQRGAPGVRCVWRSPASACPRSASVRLSVDEPQALFSACVEEALFQRGVPRLPGTLEAPAPLLPPRPEPLLTLVSPPLSALVKATNKESLNLYAERLGMRFARERLGAEDYTALRAALGQELTRRGIPSRDLRPVDGSGLSRYNLATARGLARVLFTSLREPYGAALVDSLPVAGVDGTLATRPVTPVTAGHIRAKTGTLSGQKCFTGVVDRPGDAEHPRVVFALMLGNMDDGTALPANEAFDRFAAALVELPLR